RAALARFDLRGLADAVPDALVDEIAIAGTPEEARGRLPRRGRPTHEPPPPPTPSFTPRPRASPPSACARTSTRSWRCSPRRRRRRTPRARVSLRGDCAACFRGGERGTPPRRLAAR